MREEWEELDIKHKLWEGVRKDDHEIIGKRSMGAVRPSDHS